MPKLLIAVVVIPCILFGLYGSFVGFEACIKDRDPRGLFVGLLYGGIAIFLAVALVAS